MPPFETTDPSRWQEFNQLLSQAGLPAAVPDRSTTAMAYQMDETINGPEGYFDAHPITRAIAGGMVKRCKEAANYGEQQYDTRWCPAFDVTKPETMARYYLLPYGSTALIPLEEIGQWEEITDELYPDPKCDIHLLHDCYRLRDHNEFAPAETVSLKRGEILCAFNICILCMEALTWITFSSPEYSGPYPWQDDGTRSNTDEDEDDTDPWSI